MSSSAYITIAPDAEPIADSDFREWAKGQLLREINPYFWKWEEVEVSIDSDSGVGIREVRVETYHLGRDMPYVAAIAWSAWEQFGGSLTMPEELRKFLKPGEVIGERPVLDESRWVATAPTRAEALEAAGVLAMYEHRNTLDALVASDRGASGVEIEKILTRPKQEWTEVEENARRTLYAFHRAWEKSDEH